MQFLTTAPDTNKYRMNAVLNHCAHSVLVGIGRRELFEPKEYRQTRLGIWCRNVSKTFYFFLILLRENYIDDKENQSKNIVEPVEF